MQKYPLIGVSICAVILLVLGSSCNVVGYQSGITNTQICKNGLRDDNDTTSPVTTIYFDPPVPDGLNGWYVSNVTVTLNATDNESGVWRTYCSLSPGGNYTEPILVFQDGIYHIEFWSIDNVGNVEPIKGVTLKIDKTPPVVTTTVDRIGFRKWMVTVEVSDALSGINEVEFYLNGALQVTITHPPFEWSFVVGIWELKHIKITIIAIDGAGNNASSPPITSNSYTQSQSSRQQNNQPTNQLFHNLNYYIQILPHQKIH
jgi:hypothetical protein